MAVYKGQKFLMGAHIHPVKFCVYRSHNDHAPPCAHATFIIQIPGDLQKISYLLNRLFLDTMRRKPVGSVTELSLLLSSSNCWSNKSPASLSVSLLEHPLRERERQWSERHVQLLKCWQEEGTSAMYTTPGLTLFPCG